MWDFSWGVIALAAVTLIIFFGLAQRVLDRMGLTNWQAVGVIVAMMIGSFIDFPLWRGDIKVTMNLGGAIIPLLLSIYLLIRAGTNKERVRAIFAAIVTAIATSIIGGVMMTGEVSDRLAQLDPIYIYPLVAGLIAYLLGRSRRAAFIAAILGVMGMDLYHWFWLYRNSVPGTVYLGGGGAFDSIVIAGIFAVVLAELIGEIRERLQGGPKDEDKHPALLANLKKVGPDQPGNLESIGHKADKHEKIDKSELDRPDKSRKNHQPPQPILHAETSQELNPLNLEPKKESASKAAKSSGRKE